MYVQSLKKNLTVREEPGWVQIAICNSSLSYSTLPQIEDELFGTVQEILKRGKRKIAIDLHRVKDIDVAGLSVFLSLHFFRSSHPDADLIVCSPEKGVQKLLEASGINLLFPIFSSGEEVGEHFSKDPSLPRPVRPVLPQERTGESEDSLFPNGEERKSDPQVPIKRE